MPEPVLDDDLPTIRRLARRTLDGQPWGVTAPDVAELFDVSTRTARRVLARFCRQGWLEKTEMGRHRPDMVERPCRKAIIYVATDKPLEAERWQRRLSRIPRALPRPTA